MQYLLFKCPSKRSPQTRTLPLETVHPFSTKSNLDSLLPPTTTHLHSCSSWKPHDPHCCTVSQAGQYFPWLRDTDKDKFKTLSVPSKFPNLQVCLKAGEAVTFSRSTQKMLVLGYLLYPTCVIWDYQNWISPTVVRNVLSSCVNRIVSRLKREDGQDLCLSCHTAPMLWRS